MLLGLAIRNIVLVDRLDLSLRPGLNVFTAAATARWCVTALAGPR